MSIELKIVKNKKDYYDFIKFPFYLYKDNKYWVPPLINYEFKNLYPKNNPVYNYCESILVLAYKNNKIVGRIACIINNKECQMLDKKIVRFSRIEFIDDYEISSKLLSFAENWAFEKKAYAIHGPLGFTNFDHQGLLVEGFDKLPTVASVYNHPYYEDHILKMGYKKEIDWVEYRFPVPKQIPEIAERVANAVRKRYNIEVLNFNKIEDILPYTKSILKIIEETYRDIYSSTLMDEQTVNNYIKNYLSKLNPEFIKIAVNKNKSVVGFVIGMPSLSESLQRIKGNLFPFGFIKVLDAIKRPKYLDLYLGAITPLMQGKGIPALLMVEMTKTCIKNKIKFVETNSELETNTKVQSNWKYFNTELHKRKRCYIKYLQ